MEVRSFLEGMKGSALPLPPDMELSVLGKMTGSAVGQLTRAIKYNTARNILGKQSDAQALPRNAEAFFENPDYINQLGNQIDDPDLMDQMVRVFERGDKDSFANMLSMTASENEGLFDSAPYKSLVVNNGKPVIMDKFEREQYRKFLEKTVTDPRELFDALQALNGDNVMLKPPFEPPPGYMEVKKGKAVPQVTKGKVDTTSTISQVASTLKKADATDEKERIDYSY